MTGYVRTDITNNIADGNIINATDLDNEFDGVQAAFNSSTGHNHDGTTGEGAPILVLGPTQDVVVGAAAVTPKTTNTVDIGSGSLKFKDLFLAGNASVGGTLVVTGVATLTAQPVLSSLTASSAVATDASKGLVSVTNTGTGSNVLSTSPTLVTPALGTPSSATLTNATGLPISTGVSGLGTGVATALAVNVGAAGAPVINGGVLGTPSSGTVTNLTGTASININGTVGATTASTGAFTDVTTSGTVTHNGGTANGVAYLNGSKVLTTGSALVFDGTNFATTGTASATKLIPTGGTATGNGMYLPATNVLGWSTNGTKQMELDASGNLGLGVTPTFGWSNYRALQIGQFGFLAYNSGTPSTEIGQNYYYNGTNYIAVTSGTAARFVVNNNNTAGFAWYGANASAGNAISFTQAMTLDASGNFMVGTTTQIGRLTIENSANTVEVALRSTGGAGNNTRGRIVGGYEAGGSDFGGFLAFNTTTSANVDTERARINSSGQLLVGTTVTNFGSRITAFNDSSYTFESQRSTTGNEGHIAFVNANGAVGTIFTNGTSTAYNTSSDYRLKNTIAPMTGALAKVALLKPCTYKWNVDGSDGEGFIAHELAEVVPQCVTGEKDAVDAEGKPVYQGIDTSFLVATLTAAIQEQQALIQTLTARVAALESN
jgi:hypothetical protein